MTVMGWLKRKIPGNTRVVTAVQADPDRWSIQAASLGLATATFSPMAAGIHSASTQPRGYTGDRGFGVNRWSGRTTYSLQYFRGATAPIVDPKSKRVGAGAMASGQPGLPSTGDAQQPGLSSLALMSMNPLTRSGMGG